MGELASTRSQINYKKVKPIGTPKTIGSHKIHTLEYEVIVKGCKTMRQMTVGTFTKQNPVGTFFILVSRHAFTIKDGVVIGNLEDSKKLKRIIKSAFEIK
jgi:hypothetical protein